MTTYEIAVVAGMAVWIVVAVAILVALLHAIRLLRETRAPLGQISGTLTNLSDRLKPVLHNVEQASDQARRIASRLRDDADGVGQALTSASESTGRMVDLVEERVVEIAALLAVVQEEAEETFVTTASLLRGLRRGKRKVSTAQRVARALGDREGE
ncbi:hypothetical protein [Candidatus Palauibacter sp.]|uniref:hypothetical protein n=1 Tax=Candidatus Palauibacter sp. TaxID=3101350 RepID=UPI003B51D24D